MDRAALRQAEPPRPFKRYLVFASSLARGGWDDFQGAHSSEASAEAMADYLTTGEAGFARAHVVDLVTLEVVMRRYLVSQPG